MDSALLYALILALIVSPLVFHEMGHWVALRKYGVPVTEYWLGLGPLAFRWRSFRVGMLPLGGAVVPEVIAYQKLASRQRMVVALAGPLASVIYGIALLFVADLSLEQPTSNVLKDLAHLSFFLAALNSLPIPPLDGFHAWAAWRESKGRALSPKTTELAQRVGNGLVYGFGFFLLGLVFFR